jgi:hypothetical protein
MTPGVTPSNPSPPLGIAAPPPTSVPMKLLLTSPSWQPPNEPLMPSAPLPEMTLPNPRPPPTAVADASSQLMPWAVLPRSPSPSAVVPMRLLRIFAPALKRRMPAPPLPEMTLPSSGESPPITLPGVALRL